MAEWAVLITAPWLVHPWEELATAVRSGRAVFPDVHGVGFWDYIAAHPDEGAIFDAAMTSGALDRASALLKAVDLSSVGTVVDVGGGQGLLVASLLRQLPGSRGVVADRPEVLAGAPEVLAAAGVADRVDLVAADFFTSVPEGGDAYVLSRILHDWPHEQALAILRTCRRAMHGRARLYVIEHVVPALDDIPAEERADLALKDLNVLVLVGGQERTAVEYQELLIAAGFSDVTFLGDSRCSIIEALPA